MDLESIIVGIVVVGMLGAGIYSSIVVDRRLREESIARRRAEEELAAKRGRKAR